MILYKNFLSIASIDFHSETPTLLINISIFPNFLVAKLIAALYEFSLEASPLKNFKFLLGDISI